MIAPNSRARKGEKERGRWRGSMEEYEGRMRGMLTTGNGVTQSEASCTMYKRGWVEIGHERFENGGSILGRHPGRGYTGCRRSPTL